MSAAAANDLSDVPVERRPKHIAIIMDGNGRWAARQGLVRVMGHERGVRTARAMTKECNRLGIEQLTLYCLSSENWKRPQDELDFLMHLMKLYLVDERPTILEDNLRVRMLGRREAIPDHVLAELDTTVELSQHNTGMWLNLAINYGGRSEIVDAVRSIARGVQAGDLAPDSIDEATIAQHLYTAGLADPDLLIRTAGEMRVSNFLLWQISYAEIWVTDLCWPDFTAETLHTAIRDYARRDRKYGGLLQLT